MKRAHKLLIGFISLLILTPLYLHYGLKDPLGEGKHIKKSLIQNFEKYEDVVIVVHSNKFDNLRDPLDKEVIYEEKKLTPEEKSIILCIASDGIPSTFWEQCIAKPRAMRTLKRF